MVIIAGLEPKHLEKSIYNYLTDTLKLKIKTSHIKIRGDKPTKTDMELLDIDFNTFIMEVEKIASLDDSRDFEYSITRHLYNDFTFEAVFVEN